MAIKYAINRHTYALPSKVLAREGGAHIYNVRLTADTDNGAIIRRGDYLSLDLYKQSTTPASTMTAVIREAANGKDKWYVEILTNPNHELLVYEEPIIAEDYTKNFEKLANFYNPKDSIVRAYDLVIGDVIELSKEGFSGTPAKGKSLTVSGGKFVVGN